MNRSHALEPIFCGGAVWYEREREPNQGKKTRKNRGLVKTPLTSDLRPFWAPNGRDRANCRLTWDRRGQNQAARARVWGQVSILFGCFGLFSGSRRAAWGCRSSSEDILQSGLAIPQSRMACVLARVRRLATPWAPAGDRSSGRILPT